jgi:hypothetical protein
VPGTRSACRISPNIEHSFSGGQRPEEDHHRCDLASQPRIDFQAAQAARLNGLDDEAVLRQAASQSRILVSHDKRTMPKALASFVAAGSTSPGVLLVIPQNAPVREVVEALILIWTDDQADDWRNRIAKIPF